MAVVLRRSSGVRRVGMLADGDEGVLGPVSALGKRRPLLVGRSGVLGTV